MIKTRSMDHVTFAVLQTLFPNVMIISALPNTLSDRMHFKSPNFQISLTSERSGFEVNYFDTSIPDLVHRFKGFETIGLAFNFIYQCLKELSRKPIDTPLETSMSGNCFIPNVIIDEDNSDTRDIYLRAVPSIPIMMYLAPVKFGDIILAHIFKSNGDCVVLSSESNFYVCNEESDQYKVNHYYFDIDSSEDDTLNRADFVQIQQNRVYVKRCTDSITVANKQFANKGWYINDDGDIFSAYVLSTEHRCIGNKFVTNTSVKSFCSEFNATYVYKYSFENDYHLYTVTLENGIVINILEFNSGNASAPILAPVQGI